MRYQLRRPRVWIELALFVTLAPLIVIGVVRSSSSAIPIAIGIDIVIVVVISLSWLSRRQKLARQIARNGLPGSTREISLGASSMSIRTTNSYGETPYSAYRQADTSGDFVLMQVRGTSTRAILPRQLFTDESLAFLRTKIAASDSVG